jgi:Immunity protein 31
MVELDFYEVARVLDTPRTRNLGVTNTFGIVLGKAKEGSTTSYAVLIGDETYSLRDADLKPTGKKVRREEIYSGEHITVSLDGELLSRESDSDTS